MRAPEGEIRCAAAQAGERVGGPLPGVWAMTGSARGVLAPSPKEVCRPSGGRAGRVRMPGRDLVAPLLEVTGERTTNLLVDLSSVEFFSSSFIEVLFRLWNRTKANGQQFALCGLHPYCREVLEVTNLTSVWKIYEDRDDALAALDSDMAAWSTH